MPPRYHTFKISTRITPEDVFKFLSIIKEHDNQKEYEPEFEFDWIKRKIALSANSKEGVNVLVDQFRNQLTRKDIKPEEIFLVGKIAQKDERFEAPIGVTLQDPSIFGEMIGNSLVEIGVRGITVIDRSDHCLVTVQLGPFTGGIDFRSFIMEFPLPEYLDLHDDGEREATMEEVKAAQKMRKLAKKAKKNKRKKK